MSDIAYYMSWFLKGATSDSTVVNTQAKSLYGSLVGSLGSFPGESVNR